MSFINRLFSKSKIECPRCLGKGNVDLDDIKRLKKELLWSPAACAYCEGTGKVQSNMESKVSVDTTYLSIELSAQERRKLINNDADALYRAELCDAQANGFIKEVNYLYHECKLDVNKILGLFLLHLSEAEIRDEKEEELRDSIQSIIRQKDMN